MARVSITVGVQIQPWVMPYLQLMTRLGCGERCLPVIRDFVLANGVKTATR